ncbi:single-stranded DNA-binding protein [Actinokineospora cianjurensis]|uniref:Single-strand DNA-binding protein n=1 Tax=Actinokineospora cianjurensis TaxID=585224 RepID=A0A421AZA3_9PSEU|nr:single-stranded DNA-binding protein [Actinokineospora cianjurensis]RLK55131.1 single-strand DNA-binding protein [Actinokineospora cianjurensis]
MNETMITLVGRVTGEVTHRRYGDDKDLVRFRLFTKERRYDPDQRTWVNANPMYFTVNCWDTLGAAVSRTLRSGARVVVHGKLSLRQYDNGDKQRFDAKVDARSIGADLVFQQVAIEHEEWTGPAEPLTQLDRPAPAALAA